MKSLYWDIVVLDSLLDLLIRIIPFFIILFLFIYIITYKSRKERKAVKAYKIRQKQIRKAKKIQAKSVQKEYDRLKNLERKGTL